MQNKHFFSLSFIFLFVLTSLYSQETKQVKRKHKNPYYIEQFNVLKSNQEVKHGIYKRLDFKKQVIMEGNYNHGKKEGLWSFYSYDGKLERRGKYQNDSTMGVWKIFNGLNSPKYTYNTTTEVVENYKWLPTETREEIIILNSDTLLVKVDHPVIPLTIKYEFDRVNYPAQARDSGVSGTVIISAFIDKNGDIFNLKLEQSAHPSLDQEAIRSVNENSGKWHPAFYKDKAVPSKMTFTYPFRLR